MTREELNAKIADNQKKMQEMEDIIQEKIDIEMGTIHPDRMSVLRLKEQISHLRNMTVMQSDRLKKEYAMQSSPADIGDVIEAEVKTRNGGIIREIIRTMRVERIEVAAFEEPQLTFYGTYVKQDGVTPYSRQMNVPIYQKDIIRVVKAAKH